MGDKTGIEWTDATWNPLRGCSRVSEGCRHCYAETMAARFSGPGQPYEGLARRTDKGARWTGEVRLVPKHFADPIRWARPRRIFVNSMSDLFHEAVPFETIAAIYGVMAAAPHHTFQVLTKRPQRARAFLAWVESEWREERKSPVYSRSSTQSDICIKAAIGLGARFPIRLTTPEWPLRNVWLGVSVEDQQTADERIPWLLKCPAAVRWLSMEPLLGPVDLCKVAPVDDWAIDALDTPDASLSIDWVVVGGESGPGARPMHPQWARELRDQCAERGVPFFFKQWGAWRPWTSEDADAGRQSYVQETDVPIREGGDGGRVVRVGKKRAGSRLDSCEHKAWPEARRA